VHDCIKKGRNSRGEKHSAIQIAKMPRGKNHLRYGKPGFCGETNGQAKLTEDQVRAIRADTRTQAAIAKDYGIAFQQISRIKNRTRWAHVA
jgi:DNA invertase Pin-like site-specific DNA recombinase